jgi:NADH-ubiquinone oxidoreductase chain 3
MINLATTYQEKYSTFECGYHSFLGQNRTQFGVKFFIFALVYLILDLEILLTFPYAASGYENGIYGLTLTLGFIGIITLGFVFELGKQALKIDSKQTSSFNTRPSGHLTQTPASPGSKICNLGVRRFSSSSLSEARFSFRAMSEGKTRGTATLSRLATPEVLFTKYPNIRETNIILLLVLFTIILGIYPSIITDGLNYTLSTLTYGASFLFVDNHDVVVKYGFMPAALSITSASPDYATPILRLSMKFQNNPEIAPSILDYSIKVAEGTISVMTSTVMICGVTVPVVGIAAIAICAYSLYAFVATNQLNNVVHGMDISRKELIKLVTENPILDDRQNFTELSRNIRESNISARQLTNL